MRAHPILSWDYQQVWRFLVDFELPYCKLYDMGYTSIGSRCDTEKNALLLRPDGTYKPAHTLVLNARDAALERGGRGTEEAKDEHGKDVDCGCDIGMITIGDEVLSAKVVDVNTPFACQEMRKLGISPRKAIILPDNLEEIARNVAEMSQKYKAVCFQSHPGTPTRRLQEPGAWTLITTLTLITHVPFFL